MLPVMLIGLWTVPTAHAVPDLCDAGAGSLSEPTMVWTSDARMLGLSRNDHLGRSLAILDFNGDGAMDLAIGAPGDGLNGDRAGAVYLFLGPLQPTGTWDRDDADAVLVGPGPGKNAGWSVANAGDIDLDGRDDLLIGSNPIVGVGQAWLRLGAPFAVGVLDLGVSASATMTGTAPGDEFGLAVGRAGDVDGDGYGDLVIGAPSAALAGAESGGAFVFLGPVLGARPAASADRILLGEGPGDRAGVSVGSPGDVTGDGLSDLLIGAPQQSLTGPNAGAAYLVSGGPARDMLALGDADFILRGKGSGRLGSSWSPAGDVDGDGLADFWVGASQQYASKRGAVFLITGVDAQGGVLTVDGATAEIRGRDANDLLGSSVAGGQDFNADGFTDLLVGAERADGGTLSTGAAWVLHGPFHGRITASPETGFVAGPTEGALTGAAVAAGDLNSDGYDDAVVGSPHASLARSKVGITSIFLGGDDLVDFARWYPDADGDTWGAGPGMMACTAPPHHVDRGGDCDDADRDFHPFAIESGCADPADYNCDGSVGPMDQDHDGTAACDGDCDDADPTVHPAGDERCGDGVDNDCDGLTDDGTAVDAPSWYPDLDQDGWGDPALSVSACAEPESFLQPPTTVGGDCDDGDAAVHPDAPEICDTINNDCDDLIDEPDAIGAIPVYPDVDGDGHGDLYGAALACSPPTGWVTRADDCDDANAQVHPGTAELCDLLDNDCDGRFYRGGPLSLDDAEINLSGAGASALGSALAVVPSPFLSGAASLVVGAPRDSALARDAGAVYVVDPRIAGMGAFTAGPDLIGPHHPTHLRIRGNRTRAHTGSSVAGGDVDGDGLGDLVIAADNLSHGEVSEGAVYLFYGASLRASSRGDLTVNQADGVYEGGVGDARLGEVVQVVDLDGDGFADIVAAAPGHDGGGIRRGRVYVIYGGAPLPNGDVSTVATAWIDGPADDAMLGTAVTHGDFNGDGLVDLAIGAPDADLGGGRVMVLHGDGARWSGAVGAASSVITADRGGTRIGRSLSAGDTDGDGHGDLVVGTARSSLWVVRGSPSGISSGRVEVMAAAELSSSHLGFAASLPPTLPDLNGDGLADIVFGTPDSDDAGTDAGAAWVLYGEAELPTVLTFDDLESFGRIPEGTWPTWSASNLHLPEGASLQGPQAGGAAGAAIASGDLNGDGAPDLAVGAPALSQGAGQAWAMLAGGYGLDVPSSAVSFRSSLTIDADNRDWTADVGFTTSASTPAAITWDATHLYVGMQHPDVTFGGAEHFLVMYLGDGDPAGTTTGRALHTQLPALPFTADRVLLWRADDFEMSLDSWDGSAWVRESFTSAGIRHQEDHARQTVELSIPWASLGDPTTFDLVAWWVYQGAGAGESHAALPAGAFGERTVDPDPGQWFRFDRSLSMAPSGYAAAPEGGIPALADTMTSWWPDLDQDHQGDMNAVERRDCEMHVPISFADPAHPVHACIFDPADVIDCDDTDPTVCDGAPEIPEDGIDQDCDGLDATRPPNSAPITTICDLMPALPYTNDDLAVVADGADADGDTITFTYRWSRDGVAQPTWTGPTVPATATTQLEIWSVDCTPSDGSEVGSGMSSTEIIILNELPTVVAEAPPSATEATPVTCAAASATDPDGDPLTVSFLWWVNGVASVRTPTITGASYDKGDTLRCEVFVSDGFGESSALAPPTLVINSPPPAPTSAQITPADAVDLDQLDCTFTAGGSDLDGDDLGYLVTWSLDGAPWTGPVSGPWGETIDRADVIAGEWRCEVQADDGTDPSAGSAHDTQRVVHVPVERFEQVRAGSLHACAILDGGDDVVCWGDNDHRELGRADLSTEVDVGDQAHEMGEALVEIDLSAGADDEEDDARFLHLAAASTHTCALQRVADVSPGRAGLQVRCWGGNDYGQLGLGHTISLTYASPVELGAGVRPIFVEAGQDSSCAMLSDGSVKCWGRNDAGSLGVGDTHHRGDHVGEMGDALPRVDICPSRIPTDITVGRDHACALLDDGSVKCWGSSRQGQLGLGDSVTLGDRVGEMGDALPTIDLGGAPVADVDAGSATTCARFVDGRVKCWGDNSAGALGLGDADHRGDQAGEMGTSLPYVDLGTGRTATDVDVGSDHACAVLDDGTMKCWGSGSDGRLGQGDLSTRGDEAGEMGDALPAIVLPDGVSVRADAGWKSSCAVTSCGDVHCWGDGASGRLGLESADDQPTPTAAIDLGAFRYLDAELYGTCI